MSETQEAVVLRLTRRFAAPRERVFDAFVNPDVLEQWWAAQPNMDTPVAEVDLVGEYRELKRPERLVYTWTWESNAEAMRGSEETLVEIDFVFPS